MGAGQASSRLKAPQRSTPAPSWRAPASENFPVAARLLASRQRERLFAIYGFARLGDEIGDAPSGARARPALDWLEGELDGAYAARASHPLLVRLQAMLERCALPREPFMRLIEANRMDQRVSRYQTWEQLRCYCHLSADPVGELVLRRFGAATPERDRALRSRSVPRCS